MLAGEGKIAGMWTWLATQVAAGAVRWIIGTIILAVCLMYGLAPESWIAAVIATPPVWLIHPLTKVGVVVLGILAMAYITMSRTRTTRAQLIEQFRKEFADTRDDRMYLRSELITLYLRQNWPISLKELLNTAGVPHGLPLSSEGNLVKWADSVTHEWSEDQTLLLQFAQSIYPTESSSNVNERLNEARGIASKFWDKWGKLIESGNILTEPIHEILKSNVDDIRLLVYLEIAQALRWRWDEGPGKSGLFSLSKRG